MARISPESSEAPSSWVGWKDRGKVLFHSGNFEGALNAYTQARRPEFRCPVSEQQILWSNIVACRLKIGGSRAQAEAAVEAAKQCVALNVSWAKGHVRLASAYIALGDHSNDACNELQRALQLDPGNRTARDMLVRALRRDRTNAHNQNGTGSSPSAPMEDLDDREYPSRSTQEPQDQTTPNRHQDPTRNQYNDDIDNGMSWSERFQFHFQRTKHWYDSQTDDIKAILIVCLGLVVLYVAFGGRFGLEYLSSPPSSAERRNAYEEFYQERRQRQLQQEQASRSRQQYDPYGGGYDYANDNTYHQSYSRQRRGNSWGSGGLGGGSNNLPTLLLLATVAYVAHRNGINPFQALFFANMAMGGRGRGGLGRGLYHGGWGHGGMMGGFRHRAGRPRW
jgi:tetratricopeptide (TPR) repeat protein